ncbi:MAG: biopolymer transporter ExbD [Spirochaetales bacterium]|nr:biopolymer transporter ExbD [Spirochaetales bacterium]
MTVKRKSKKHLDIANSGALSDLAFLLIIFFIVVAVFNINKGFILLLPKKDSVKIINVNDIIKVTLKDDGTLLYENKTILLSELERIVKDTLSLYPNMTLLLSIYPEVPYQQVVHIVDLVRKLNVENFSFAMAGEKT